MAVALEIESKCATFVKVILNELGKWNISASFQGLILSQASPVLTQMANPWAHHVLRSNRLIFLRVLFHNSKQNILRKWTLKYFPK